MRKQETITVETTRGPTTISAWVDLELAVHPVVGDIRDDGPMWTITHLPTGMSFGRGGHFASKASALAAMKDLLATDIVWADPSDVVRNGRTIREIMERHGAVGSVPPAAPAVRKADA